MALEAGGKVELTSPSAQAKLTPDLFTAGLLRTHASGERQASWKSNRGMSGARRLRQQFWLLVQYN